MSTSETKVYKSKWYDPTFIREYYRNRQREVRGLKRHPNLTTDGKRWLDVYPEDKPKPRKRKQTKKLCEVCLKEYFHKKSHEKSKFHIGVVNVLSFKEQNVVSKQIES